VQLIWPGTPGILGGEEPAVAGMSGDRDNRAHAGPGRPAADLEGKLLPGGSLPLIAGNGREEWL